MKILVLVLGLGICPFCFAQEEVDAGQEVRGFSLTQYEEGGERKWELNGRSAEVGEEKVKIEEISAVVFGEKAILKLKAREGDLDRRRQLVHLENNVVAKTTDGIRLATDSLYWDSEHKSIYSDAIVNIKRADFEVNGKGIFCDLEKEITEFKKDITANIKSSDADFLRTTSKEQLTTITCDGPLEINYKKNKATFQNNVKVENVQGNIFADRIDVYFNQETRRVRLVVARGDVRIVNGESVTYSEKAIYLVEQGRVVLPKRPKLIIQNESSE